MPGLIPFNEEKEDRGILSFTVFYTPPGVTQLDDLSAEKFLTVQEVAQLLRVNEATVRRWVKIGALDAIKLPHRGKREIYRIRQSTLESILKYLSIPESDT